MVCAVRELKEIGYQFELDYEKNVLNAEESRIEQIHRNKEKRNNNKQIKLTSSIMIFKTITSITLLDIHQEVYPMVCSGGRWV